MGNVGLRDPLPSCERLERGKGRLSVATGSKNQKRGGFGMKKFIAGGVILGTISTLMLPSGLPLAHAQQVPRQQPSQQGNNISEEELKAFAKAYKELQEIRLKYEPTLKGVQDPKEIERIQREALSRVEETLERQGLNVESYNRILVAVNGDEQLRKKTLKLIEEEQKRS